ncbi:MAG: AAA family ATPase [Candidatus Xenobia bacterium]
MDFVSAVNAMTRLMDGSAVREAQDMWSAYRVSAPEGGAVPAPSEQFQGTVIEALNASPSTVVGMALRNQASGRREQQLSLDRRDGVVDFAQAQTLHQVPLTAVADRLQGLTDRGNAAALLAAGALLPATVTAGWPESGWLRAGLKLNPESSEFLKRGDHVVFDGRPGGITAPRGANLAGYVGQFRNEDGKPLVEIHQQADLSDAPDLCNVLWVAKDAALHGPRTAAPGAPPPSPAAPAQPTVTPAAAAPATPAATPVEAKPEEKPMTIEERLKKIDDLVGLEDVKAQVHTFVNLLKARQRREKAGLKNPVMSYHMVALGNPGTGKTTVLRELGLIMRDLGILKKGHLIEATRADLVAQFEGQTAPKTRAVCESAMGGLLLIDEAYAVCRDGQDSYGQEAVAELLKIMEDKRDQFVCVMAGYPGPMQNFLNSNPGFDSRVSERLAFKDYSTPELVKIFGGMCKDNDYKLDKSAQPALQKLLDDSRALQGEKFANARTARLIFEKAIKNQANRLAKVNDPSDAALSRLTAADVESIKPGDLVSEEDPKTFAPA